MYEYHNHTLSIPARLLYEDWGLMSYRAYQIRCDKGRLVRTREGRGPGNEAFVSFKDLPNEIKNIALKLLGDPNEVAVRNKLLELIKPDTEAARFFSDHRRPNGRPLEFEKQVELATNCIVLNAVRTAINNSTLSRKVFGKKATWQNISEAVNTIPEKEYKHSLPGNWRILKKKYEQYCQKGYHVFIHANEGNDNTLKIKDDIADFILAQYCLPIKMSVPMVTQKYEQVRLSREWPALSEAAVGRWLMLPEQERIWSLARDGKDVWRRKFANSIVRDRSNWFPNAYWAIDGSKIDWVYYDDDSGNKRAAKLKINPLIDVYSEKIIGWSFSETEDHTDHIRAVNMALHSAGVRPYLLTYDKQSGHRMERMQSLYSEVVAKAGGTHYSHKAGQKSNPMEQLFNRLQQQVLNMMWFSDKQSVKVRTDRNRINQEFIAENTHNLYTKDQLLQAFEMCVEQWNNARHPHFQSMTRSEVYNQPMPMREEVSVLEIANMVWVQESKATYKRDGITMRLGKNKFTFEVYDHNDKIDLEFRRTSIGKQFAIRYNPDYLDSYVQLCEILPDGKKLFAACAQPKRTHETIPVLMDDHAKEKWWADFKTQEEEFQRDKSTYNALVARTGISRQALIDEQELTIKMSGFATKHERSMAEANEYDF